MFGKRENERKCALIPCKITESREKLKVSLTK